MSVPIPFDVVSVASSCVNECQAKLEQIVDDGKGQDVDLAECVATDFKGTVLCPSIQSLKLKHASPSTIKRPMIARTKDKAEKIVCLSLLKSLAAQQNAARTMKDSQILKFWN